MDYYDYDTSGNLGPDYIDDTTVDTTVSGTPVNTNTSSTNLLLDYFNSSPAFINEYNRIRNLPTPDRRTPEQWMQAVIATSPEESQNYQNFVANPAATTITPAATTVTQTGPNINPDTGRLFTDAELSAKYSRDNGGITPDPAMLAGYKIRLGVTEVGPATNTGSTRTGTGTGTGGTTASGRNINTESFNTLQAQINIAGPEYDAYAAYAPKYAQKDIDILAQSLFGPNYTGKTLSEINAKLTEEASKQTETSNTALRRSDIEDVETYGKKVSDIQRAANPDLYTARDQVKERTNLEVPETQQFRTMQDMANAGFQQANPFAIRDVGQSFYSPMVGTASEIDRAQVDRNDIGLATATQRLAESGGPSALQRTLEQQAMEGLALGRSLSPEDIRNAQQSAREAYSARNLVNTNAAVATEVLNREALGRQREKERQDYAAGVEQAGYAQRQQGFQNAIGLSDAYRGYGSLGLQAALANQSASAQMAQLGQQAGMSNQQSVLDTNRLNASQQGVNQQADLNRSQQNLQYLNRADANRMNVFNQLGTLDQNTTARKAQELAQFQQQFQNQISTQIDPFQGVLGRASSNSGNNQNLFGQSSGSSAAAGATRAQFDPFSAYGGDLANTNYNAQEAAKIAAGNNAAALQAANIQGSASKSAGRSSMFGALGGAAIGAAALL